MSSYPSSKGKSLANVAKAMGKGKGKGQKLAFRTKSQLAGLQFPVTRIRRLLKRDCARFIIRQTSSVYLTAVLEYLVAEILELAGNAARDHKKKRIAPRHLLLAIRNDDELDRLLQGVTISEGGVVPSIQPVLLNKRVDGRFKIESGSMDL